MNSLFLIHLLRNSCPTKILRFWYIKLWSILSISCGIVVHEYPLKSLNGSTILILFPTFINSEIVSFIKKYSSFIIFSFLPILLIAYNIFLSIGYAIIFLFSWSIIYVFLSGILFCSSLIFIISIESQLFFIISIMFATYSSFVCISFFTVSMSLYDASIL